MQLKLERNFERWLAVIALSNPAAHRSIVVNLRVLSRTEGQDGMLRISTTGPQGLLVVCGIRGNLCVVLAYGKADFIDWETTRKRFSDWTIQRDLH